MCTMATAHLSFLAHDENNVTYANTVCVHWEATGIGGDADYSNAVHEAGEWLADHWLDTQWPHVVLDRIRLLEAGSLTPQVEERVYDAPGTGPDNAGKCPRECALVMSFKTAHYGRSGRGHISLPNGRDSNYVTNQSKWDTGSAFWAAAGVLKDAMLAGHTWTPTLGAQQHMSLRVWSKKLGESFDITSIVLREPVRWVRRRQTAP